MEDFYLPKVNVLSAPEPKIYVVGVDQNGFEIQCARIRRSSSAPWRWNIIVGGSSVVTSYMFKDTGEFGYEGENPEARLRSRIRNSFASVEAAFECFKKYYSAIKNS